MISSIPSAPPVQSMSAPRLRMIKAAHEFEAQMMKELLKPLTSNGALNGDEEDGGSGGALGEFAAEALGQGLSERGGLGIANSIIASLSGSKSGNLPKMAQVTNNPQIDTGMRGTK